MKTVSVNVFEYDELKENAQAKARDWFREHALDYEWWEYIYEDARTIGLEITGFDLYRRDIEGALTEDVKTVCKRIKAEHGKNCGTHKFASRQDLRRTVGEQEHSDFLRGLLQEYLVLLDQECEYRLSDEAIAEDIRANEYTFTEDGRRFRHE